MSDKDFEIFYLSAADNSMQPALLQKAKSSAPRPLLVALHTWSCDHFTCSWEHYRSCCEKLDWHLIYPAFRGPNTRPEACGSDLVVKDIVSALEYAKSVCNVKPEQVYLAGGSGGGHASLLLAGLHPELWTAVSAWCPISDIAAWHKECESHCREYHDHIELVCQGDPQSCARAREDAIKRSPATYLANARNKTVIDISTGIHDGHIGSVPISHAFRAFNLLCDPADRFSESEIEFMVKNEAVPEALQYQGEPDKSFREKTVLLRRISGNVRITIFEGGHDLLPHAALAWLNNQLEPMRPDWQLCMPCEGTAKSTELTR